MKKKNTDSTGQNTSSRLISSAVIQEG